MKRLLMWRLKMENRTIVERSGQTGKYIAFVKGYRVGEYTSLSKALQKMSKYAKSQDL